MIGPPVGQIVPHPIERVRGNRLGRNRADNPAHSNGTRDEAIRDRTGKERRVSEPLRIPLRALAMPSKLDGWRGSSPVPAKWRVFHAVGPAVDVILERFEAPDEVRRMIKGRFRPRSPAGRV